jgi:raffinose/stachyose/melibiose transport system permease protein
MRNGRGRLHTVTLVKFLTIPTVFYLFTVITPIFFSIYYSTFNWNGGPKKLFIGIKNYQVLFKNMEFWQSVSNNFMLIFYCLIGQVLVGLFIAILLNTKYLRFRAVYRFLIFLPCILSGVVVTFLWQIIYNANYGLFNWLLKIIHLESWIHFWLDDPKFVMKSIAIVLIWQYVGQNVVIFLASLQNIDPDIIEAATIDGASGLQRTFRIIIPLMKGTIRVVVIFCISGNMKVFEHIYNMTRGGPGTASSVMSVFAYKTSFENLQMGYGSAASVSILAISLVSIAIANFLLRGEKNG